MAIARFCLKNCRPAWVVSVALIAGSCKNHGQRPGGGRESDAGELGNGYELRVLEIQSCPTPNGAALAPGHVRLAVHIELSSTASEPVPVNTFYAKIVDSQQRWYTATFAGCEPVLRHAPLRHGERTRGLITFELPDDASGLKLVYAPRLSHASIESPALVDLGR